MDLLEAEVQQLINFNPASAGLSSCFVLIIKKWMSCLQRITFILAA